MYNVSFYALNRHASKVSGTTKVALLKNVGAYINNRFNNRSGLRADIVGSTNDFVVIQIGITGRYKLSNHSGRDHMSFEIGENNTNLILPPGRYESTIQEMAGGVRIIVNLNRRLDTRKYRNALPNVLNKVVTSQEASKITGVHRTTINKACERGDIIHRRAGKIILIDTMSLREWSNVPLHTIKKWIWDNSQ